MLGEDVMEAILEAMKLFPGNAPVQKNACNALKQLLTDGKLQVYCSTWEG